MNKYMFVIGILVPMGASATGVSFGLGSGEGVVKALFILYNYHWICIDDTISF
jgi:hypothetical protein